MKNIPSLDSPLTVTVPQTPHVRMRPSFSLLLAPAVLASSLTLQKHPNFQLYPSHIDAIFYFHCHPFGLDFHYPSPVLFQVFPSSNHPWLYTSAARFGKHIIYYLLYARYCARHFNIQNLIFSSYNPVKPYWSYFIEKERTVLWMRWVWGLEDRAASKWLS